MVVRMERQLLEKATITLEKATITLEKGNCQHHFYFEVVWHLALNIQTKCGMCCFSLNER